MKINFLSLNENLRYQRLAVKEMMYLNWIDLETAKKITKALNDVQDFNDSIIRENNGIEIIDASAADRRQD